MVALPRQHTPELGGVAKVTYDYEEYGGEIGDITLPFTLPKAAILLNAFTDVGVDANKDPVPLAGAGATVALRLEAADDVVAATAIASLGAPAQLIPDGTIANAVQVTEDRDLIMTIGTAAITGGKLNIFLSYYIN